MSENRGIDTIIAVLLVIAILISATSLYYTITVTNQLIAANEELRTALEQGLANLGQQIPELPPTITVVGPWAGKELDAFEPVIDRFERLTGINVVIRILRAEDLASVLPAQFEAGQAPGDLIFMWASFIRANAPEGHMMNLTDIIDEATLMAGALTEVTVDSEFYGGVYTGKVKPGFWYRKSFFQAHNLAVPTTWQEFSDLLETIKGIDGIVNPIATGDGVGWPISDVTEHFLITFGGPDLQKDLISGDVDWTSTQVRSIFADRIVPLLQAGYFSEPIEWTTALNLWWQGDYALYFMGSWITGMVDDPEDLGVFSLPGSEGIVFAADYFFIPTYTEHLDEAKQLAEFLSSAEAQRLQVAQGGHVATAIGVSLDEYPAVDKVVAGLTTGKEIVRDLDDAIGGEFRPTFWDQLKLLWVDPTALDEVLAALQEKAP
ncbi:MAG: ABC transporter substrate-binding protein [Candidatus Bathyarchaeota archaeon]|nr:ABC transporter substrate-binding protein [Candidatus Bathyarchaeota archaeon]